MKGSEQRAASSEQGTTSVAGQSRSLLAAVCLLLAISSAVAWAKPEVLFPPAGNVQSRLASEIDRCSQSIDAALFELSARPLIQALERAGQRGVNVRLVLDAGDVHPGTNARILQRTPNVQVRRLKGRKPHGGFMHNKYAVLDASRVATGSYNWTQGAEHANYENLLIEDDPDVVQAYVQNFSELWSQAGQAPASSARARHRRGKSVSQP
jgi:phosphatidylserine/phosphatidylglycerophosphate/cardiolipin synthase-like enzyme